jgi:outer membrane usher protein
MRRLLGVAAWMVVMALIAALALRPARAELRAQALAPALNPVVLALTVNGVEGSDAWVLLSDGSGGLWADAADLARLRLKPPPVAPTLVDGRSYFPLAAIAGAHIEVDTAAGRATLTVPAGAFSGVTRSAPPQAPPALTPSPPGAFLNYQLYGQRGDYAGAANSSLTTELGVFSALGVLTSTATAVHDASFDRGVRLETTFTRDFPSSLVTLRLGDAITTPGSWDGAVRFAGVQWGTNFALRPDLLTLPLLSVAGQATLPSTVDVFVNGHQVTTQQVPPGPFVVDRLPTVTGTGDVSLVVQDAEGRTQVVSVPFYSSATLLQAGLNDYSFEAGAIRDNFALDSDDYGPAILAGTWRRGLTNSITVEGHAEVESHGPRSAGAQYAERLGTFGVLDTELAVGGLPADSPGAAASSPKRSTGGYAAVGFEHAARPFNVAARIEWAGSGFSDLSASAQTPLPRVQEILQAGYDLHRAGNLALAAAIQQYPGQPTRRVVSLTHNLSIGERGFLSLTASRTVSTTTGTSVYLVYTRALGNNRSVSATARYDNTQPAPEGELQGTLQQNPPVGNGEGYRVTVASNLDYDADLRSQFAPLVLDAEAARTYGQSAERASVTGALAWLDGVVRPLRQVTDSFALVDAAGVPDVTVFVENQPVGRTDADGVLLVPHLRPYERNHLSIDPAQLPLDVSVDVPSIDVVPAYRSGATVRLPVARDHAGVFHLQRADGRPVPAGAIVTLKSASFPVGLDGLTYVKGYDHGLRGEAAWDGGHCAFRLPPPPGSEPVPDVGVIRCTSVRP